MGGSVIFTQWAEGAVRVRGRRVRFVEVGRVRRLVGGSRLRLRAREETGRRWRVENSRMVGRCMLGFELIGSGAEDLSVFRASSLYVYEDGVQNRARTRTMGVGQERELVLQVGGYVEWRFGRQIRPYASKHEHRYMNLLPPNTAHSRMDPVSHPLVS